MASHGKQFYAIRAALQPGEKALIEYYELQWNLRNRVPTVDEVYKHLKRTRENLSLRTVHYWLNRAPVRAGLKKRGIPFEQHTQSELTEAQMAAAITVMNMMDDRPIKEKLDELGILPATYYGWLNDPQFKNFLDAKADQNKVNIRPHAVAEFTKKINGGDWNAIKYWLEVTGEFNNNEAPATEQMLKMIIEIIQEEVQDGDTIMRIAQRMMNVMSIRGQEIVEIEGSVTNAEDIELETAKKMLGV